MEAAPGDEKKGALRAYSVGAAPATEWAHRLHLNEYRYDHPAEVTAAARLAAEASTRTLALYPAGPDPELCEALARYVGAPSAACVLVTAGSDEALRAAVDTSGLRGHEAAVLGVPSYTHFEHFVRLRGLRAYTYTVGLQTCAEDHEAALRYHADRLAAGCLVYLCSPNNPTGDLWAPPTVDALAAEYPRSLFLVDEAYVEFASLAGARGAAADAADAAALNASSLVGVALARPNVVVTRTLSKAFGLAALRVGYAVGQPATVAQLGVAVSPKALGPLAARVACAALRNLAHYRAAAAAARVEAAATVTALRAAGWWALDTPANYYLVYAGAAPGASAALAAALGAAGVHVRDRGDQPGLAGFVRITAGTRADSAAVRTALAARAPPRGPPPQTLYTPKGHVAACKTLMKRTLRLLRSAGFEFFATAGTMLGMYRHGGMIPVDDDGDLAYVREPGRDQAADLVPLFAAAGLTLQRNRTGAYWQVGTGAAGEPVSAVHVDLFSFRLEGGRYLLDDERFRAEDPRSPRADCNTSYAPDELYPLRGDYRYYDEAIPMPAQPGRVLQRALGADFMRVMRMRGPAGEGPAEVQLLDYAPA